MRLTLENEHSYSLTLVQGRKQMKQEEDSRPAKEKRASGREKCAAVLPGGGRSIVVNVVSGPRNGFS